MSVGSVYDMKRVGILTFHSVRNFGAVIQAWSTPQIIRSMGAAPEVIDYRPSGHHVKSRRSGLRRYVPSIGGIRSDLFVKRALPLSPRVFTTHAEVDHYVRQENFDVLLTGSDQVWYSNDFLGFDRAYFLDVGDPRVNARISYAPSAGPMSELGPDQVQGERILSTYKAVSVRDANTLSLANSVGRDDAVVVVDPTILADLRPLVGQRPLQADYMLITGPMNADAYALLGEIARREGLKVIEIGRSYSFADKSHPFVNPREWVNHIAHASLVASSLFHGCAIAISLRRPFLALDTAGRGFKLVDMLTRLGMEDRFVPSDRLEVNALPADLTSFNYERVNSTLECAREVSFEFLRSAINA
ncbi:MAG: polysaccharide pyruvyl transferase family protein [Rhizobacter sp.]